MEIAEKLTQYSKKQVDFIMAMLETGNIARSCKIANITETTAFKYLKNGLDKEINNIRQEYIEIHLKKLEYMAIKAIDVICEILHDDKCTNMVKFNVSRTVLDYSLKVREQTQVIERLERIEERIKNNE